MNYRSRHCDKEQRLKSLLEEGGVGDDDEDDHVAAAARKAAAARGSSAPAGAEVGPGRQCSPRHPTR
jgi:hypothetical protein